MKRNLLLFGVLLVISGCTPKGRGVDPSVGTASLADYLPLKAGNAWTYSAITTAKPGDTSTAAPVKISIYQTNVLIGGQPNAFIVRTDNQEGQSSYLAFCMKGNTLLHYLGTTRTYALEDNTIIWIPGGAGGAVVGVGQTAKYYVDDRSGDATSYYISSSPDSSVANAQMTAPDTVEISGEAEGRTALTLRAAGGKDTMTVIVGVTDDPPSSITSPLMPWLPIWQMADSASAATMFSSDTTFVFSTGTADYSDELFYLVTNRHVGKETLQDPSLSCERFRMKVTLFENITATDSAGSRTVFSGTSADITVDMWLAKGTGFVKGLAAGSSLPPAAVMGGTTDSTGVLEGYYISPRVAYASLQPPGESRRQYLFINDAPIDSAKATQFKLVSKNF